MKIKRIIILLMFAVAIIGIIAPVSATVDTISSEKKVYTIESKEKAVELKIKWNANGGKIGSKKTVTTTVKKGNKIGKLPKTPTRSGYTFKGWYTMKTGGKEINKNTKPTKSVTYYAQWENNKNLIVGRWQYVMEKVETKKFLMDNFTNQRLYSFYQEHGAVVISTYDFKKDGTYSHSIVREYSVDDPKNIYINRFYIQEREASVTEPVYDEVGTYKIHSNSKGFEIEFTARIKQSGYTLWKAPMKGRDKVIIDKKKEFIQIHGQKYSKRSSHPYIFNIVNIKDDLVGTWQMTNLKLKKTGGSVNRANLYLSKDGSFEYQGFHENGYITLYKGKFGVIGSTIVIPNAHWNSYTSDGHGGREWTGWIPKDDLYNHPLTGKYVILSGIQKRSTLGPFQFDLSNNIPFFKTSNNPDNREKIPTTPIREIEL